MFSFLGFNVMYVLIHKTVKNHRLIVVFKVF